MGKALTNDELAAAVQAFQKAMLEQNETALCEVVDFDRLQANIKARLRRKRRGQSEKPSTGVSPTGSSADLEGMNDAVIELFFSPAGMLALVTKIIPPDAGPGEGLKLELDAMLGDHVAVIALFHGQAVFTRQARGWRMTNLVL